FVPSDHYGLEARLSSAGGAPSWTVENGKLTVNANAEGWLVNLFSFSGENLHYVKIYYPAGASFTGVTLETSSGDVKLPQTAVENLAVTSVSGNVRAEADGYGTAFIQTSSGDVTFSGAAEPTIKVGADATATVTYGMLINGDGTVSVTTITTSDGKQYKINMDGRWTSSDGTPVFGIPDGVTNLIIDTVSGNIHANAENCGGVTLISVSGDISLTGGGDTPAAVNLKTVSGTVAAGGMVWNALAAESSSGDIRVSGTPQGTSTEKSVSGDVALTLQTRAALIAYDLSSVSGSIAVGGTGMGSPARSAAGTPADKLVDAKTSSGDIRVDFTE
ncbi:MAG: DUF4097 domain-containing protein, partial [Defluviitaleaceae bacterium]|nr:DUF4097 domain-containing protein [Defluviitaleaceae bacterium]